MPDIVYVLTNPAMPGFVKIGYTTQDDVQVRMKQLHTTGVPEPFECAMAVQVREGYAKTLEKALHTAFAPDQGNASREFFKMDPARVLAILRIWPGRDVTPKGNAKPKTTTKKKSQKGRRLPFTFERAEIPVGSTITLTRTDEDATVLADNHVLFRDKEMSLTAATKLVFGKHRWPTPEWTFEGQTLEELYQRVLDSQL